MFMWHIVTNMICLCDISLRIWYVFLIYCYEYDMFMRLRIWYVYVIYCYEYDMLMWYIVKNMICLCDILLRYFVENNLLIFC